MRFLKQGRAFLRVMMLVVVAGTVLAAPTAAQAVTAGGEAAVVGTATGPVGKGPSAQRTGPTLRAGAPSVSANRPQVWYGHWYPGPNCQGTVCSSTSTDDLPRFWISGQDFSFGRVYVGIFRLDGSPIVSGNATGGHWPGFVDASWGYQFNVIDCAAIGAPVTNNSFIQAHDVATNRWSNRIYVTTGCRVL